MCFPHVINICVNHVTDEFTNKILTDDNAEFNADSLLETQTNKLPLKPAIATPLLYVAPLLLPFEPLVNNTIILLKSYIMAMRRAGSEIQNVWWKSFRLKARNLFVMSKLVGTLYTK